MVGGQLEVAVHLVHGVDVVELSAGGGQLLQVGPIAGQVDLVEAAMRTDQ